MAPCRAHNDSICCALTEGDVMLHSLYGLSSLREEAPHKGGRPGQYDRCPRYGHANVNCYAQPCCVKCLVHHWTRECPLTKESTKKPSCVNFGQVHTANYKRCPKAPKGKKVSATTGEGNVPAPAPSVNPSGRKQPSRVEPEPSREAFRQCPSGLAPARPVIESVAAFADDIQTVISVLRIIKSLEISEIGSLAGGYPKPMIKISNGKKVSTALKEVDTPALNNIPYVIDTTNEIDTSIGALTNHIRKVVKRCLREFSASVDRQKLPANALELLRTKNAALRHAYAYPSRENRSRVRARKRRVRARMIEVINEEWSNLMENITPTHQAFWKLTKALKSEGYLPTPPLKKADSSVVVEDLEKVEYLADSLELQCFRTIPPRDNHHITRIEEEVRHKTSLDP
ncbi:hypothetical protein EVAR_4632_1 [Eumeta japonica]|uniref:Uncharacterized protein n=1 Tax=Eumeta variegata TaxID=151549 RepID=A0A4C1SX62_EUMVA|nr:hypothetical protein EVAR_4632_1 [Eumeta japonica]